MEIHQTYRKICIAGAFLCGTFIFAQTHILEGRVLDDKDNSPVEGVTVSINDKQVTTDVSGNFSVSLDPKLTYTLKISNAQYQSKEISDVSLSEENTHLDILLHRLEAKESNIEGVVLKSSAKKESIASTIALQKNSAVVSQVIGVEAIKKSPDRNTGEVLKRVSGVSLLEGKYIVVRGLSDRYNQAMLNGIQLSSTEPDKKTFSFDLFPANVIETLVINKAFIPEYTGEWAGGLIQVNTKDIPAKNFF